MEGISEWEKGLLGREESRSGEVVAGLEGNSDGDGTGRGKWEWGRGWLGRK